MNKKRKCCARFIESLLSAQGAGRDSGYVLKIAAVDDDSLPKEWTRQVSHCAIQLVGPNSVRTARWTVSALRYRGVLQDATDAAIEADILVMSVSAAREMPLHLNMWIDSWLPYRLPQTGALVAVVGVPQQPSAFPARIREYLLDVAHLAHLDFLSQEQRLPLELPGVSGQRLLRNPQQIGGV